MQHKLIIEPAENGWILSWLEEGLEEENATEEKKEVVSAEEPGQAENEPEEYTGMTRLLERVADFFGYTYNKYGENNLNISWDRKGHKL